MKKNLLYITLGLMSLGTVGCSDFLDEYSQDLVTAKSVYDLNELLIGDVYLRSQEVTYGMSNSTMAFVNLLDDDINTTGSGNKQQQGNLGLLGSGGWTNSVSPTFGYFAWQQDVRQNYTNTSTRGDAETWNTLYKHISVANNIIELIDNMPRNTDDEKSTYHRVKGEAHFTRAQFYWALANLYGKPYRLDSASIDLCVPLKLSAHVQHSKDKDTQFERATVNEVYQQVVNDLLISREALTTSPQQERYRLHRASAEAAGLLLSRVYLYMQKWAEAEQAAQKVIETNNFSLAPISSIALNRPFLTPSNPEIIFSQGSNHVAPKTERLSLSGNYGDFCVSRDLYDAFDSDDARLKAFFTQNAFSDSIQLMKKYERGLTLNHISDAFTLRLSEAYLNHAEACAMQKGKETQANTSLKTLRLQRINHYTHTDLSGEELVNEVRKERRLELCFEGHRWFDLRRYAVCEQYPLRKTLVHTFNQYNEAFQFIGGHVYTLPPGDPNWVFAIPREVIEFDKVPMPDNLRVARPEQPKAPTLPIVIDDNEEGDNSEEPTVP